MPPKRKPAAAAAASSGSAAAASASQDWTVPDLDITDASRPRISAILIDLLNAPSPSALFREHLTRVNAAILCKSYRSVAEVDGAIETAGHGSSNNNVEERRMVEQILKQWRTKITELAQAIAREAAMASLKPPTLSSKPVPAPPTAAALPTPVAAASSAAASSASAVAASAAVVSDSHAWIPPDLPITNAIRPRVSAILSAVQASLGPSFAWNLENIQTQVLSGSLRSVAEVDRVVTKLFSLTIKAYNGRLEVCESIEHIQQQWRRRITELAQSIARETAMASLTPPPLSSRPVGAPPTAAAAAVPSLSTPAAAASSSSSAAAASAAAAPASQEWTIPDFAITDVTRPFIVHILNDLRVSPFDCVFAEALWYIREDLLRTSLRSVTEVDCAIEQIFSVSFKAVHMSEATWMGHVDHTRKLWRTWITQLAQVNAREGATALFSKPAAKAATAAAASSLSTSADTASSGAASSSSATAAAVSTAAAPASPSWLVPDVALTAATRPRVLRVLADLTLFAPCLAKIKALIDSGFLRSVAEVDGAIERLCVSGCFEGSCIHDCGERIHRQWRTNITELVQSIAREAAGASVTLPVLSSGPLAATPPTASAAPALSHSPVAASTSSAAAATASGSKDWVVPDLAITYAIRPCVVRIFNDLQATPDFRIDLFVAGLERIKEDLLYKTLRSVAEADRAVELLCSSVHLAHTRNLVWMELRAEQIRQQWRAQIRKLALAISREATVASVTPSALSTRPVAAPRTMTAVPALLLSTPAAAAAFAASSRSAAVPVAAAPDLNEWIIPNLAITNANRPRICVILVDLVVELGTTVCASRMAGVMAQLLNKSLRSFADVDRDVDTILTRSIRHCQILRNLPMRFEQARQQWRTKITKLAQSIVREALMASVKPPAPSLKPVATPPTAATAAALSQSPVAASSSSAAAASASAAAASKQWIVPDLALTDAIRPRVLAVLTDVQSAPASALFEWSLDDIKRDLLQRPVRSVAEVDRDIEAMIALTLDANNGRFNIGTQIQQTRQLWRTKITGLAGQIGREDAVLHASSTSSAAASSSSSAASTPINAAAAVPIQAFSSSSDVAVVVPTSAAASAVAASLPLSSTAADRAKRMLLNSLSADMLDGDVATVLQQARQHSAMQQRVAELESAHAALLSSLEDKENRIRGVKQEKLDAQEAMIKSTQLKRKRETELDDERKKLRVTEQQLEQQSGALDAQRANLASVADQLTEQRAVVAGLEQEHAELVSLLHTREDSTGLCLSIVKLENAEARDALVNTAKLKRKAEEERDEVHKKLRSTTDQLERKTEQLDQLDCVACMDARACVLNTPCGCAALCAACDAAHQGGPDRAAAAGRRSCPKCCAEIVSASHIAHHGQ